MRREPLARGDQDLFLHQVAAVHLLGDRVLHLDARVHLDEVIMPFVIDQEFDRAGVLITDRFRQLDRGVAHFLAQARARSAATGIPR